MSEETDDEIERANATARRIVGARKGKHSLRRADFNPSPPEAGHRLLDVEAFSGGIWECACGDGALSKVFLDRGHTVESTDLHDRGFGLGRVDFLMERRLLAPNIVTNPPFKLAQEFIEHALDLGAVKVAMLLRLQFLETPGRQEMFERTPFKKMWVFSKRLPMMHSEGYDGDRLKSSILAFAWFVWERGHNGPATIGWL